VHVYVCLHEWHYFSTPQRMQHQQNVLSKTGSAAQWLVPTAQSHHQRAAEKDREIVKCVRTRAGRWQAGSKYQHQHAKNASCHA